MVFSIKKQGKYKYKMKVSKQDILNIKPNTSMTFQLDSYKDCLSVRQYAYQLSRSDPRPGVKRYSVSIDGNSNCVTITALRK